MTRRLLLKYETLETTHVILYFLMWLLYIYTGNIMLFYLQVIIGYSSVLHLFNAKNLKKTNLLVFLLSISLILVLSNLITGNLTILNILFNIHYPFIAILIVNSKLNIKLINSSYCFHVLFFAVHFLNGIDPNQIFETSSRNYISIVMLIQTILLYLTKVKWSKKITVIPALVTVIISFLAIGRSGIFSSLILLLGVVLQVLSVYKINYIKLIINFLPTIFIAVLILFSLSYLSIFSQIRDTFEVVLYRFNTLEITNDARFIILRQYIDSADNYMKIIFGSDFRSIPFMSILNNNLHNSYLKLHAHFGLIGIMLYSGTIGYTILKYFSKRLILYLFMFLSILIRIGSDTAAFPGVFDSIILYFIFQKDIYPSK